MIVSASTIKTIAEAIYFPFLWRLIAAYSQHLFILLLAGLWLYWLVRRTRETWRLPGSITAGLALGVPINELLKSLFGRARPFVAGNFTPLVEHAADSALPSNHAMATAVFTYGFCRLTGKAWSGLIAALTLLVGVARVITGLHFPIDILAGWLVGALCGAAGEFLTGYLEKWTLENFPF